MRKNQIGQSLQIGFTYIGTVVGAGFASGQEILKFFSVFGEKAYWGILLSSLLFAWIGIRILFLGAQLRAESYRKLTAYLFGEKPAMLIDLFMLIMLFGVTVAMLAGVGALFQEHFKIPFQIGVLVTMGLTYVTIIRGMRGILTANSIIVPVMISLISFIYLNTIFANKPLTHSLTTLATSASPISFSWIASAISYAAFNLGLAVSVLVPLGNEIQNRTTLFVGGLIGAFGLGIMLMGAHFAMSQHLPQILHYQVPMAYITNTYGMVFQILFIVVLWGEIFSTLLANVYGISSQLAAPRFPAHGSMITVLILTSAFFVSQVGFSNIVSYLYPIFGYISFLLLVFLIWPSPDKPVSK